MKGREREEGFCQDFINTYIERNNYARIKTEENFPELVSGLQAGRRERPEPPVLGFTVRPAKQQ